MTSKATPISNIDSSPSGGEALQMPIIQDILDEIGHDEGDFPVEAPMITHETRDTMNVPHLNYQMDPNINALPNTNTNYNAPSAMNMYQTGLMNRTEKKNIFTTVLKELRLPVLVILLYTVFRRFRVDNLLVKRLSFAMTNGHVNVAGTMLTATLFAVVFWGGKFALENININI